MLVGGNPTFVGENQDRTGIGMGQQQERTGLEKAAGEHEAARVELQRLIDNPEKHLPVIDYIAHLRDAKKAVARTYKALQAHGG